ncbi:MAG: LPP20 family lipoprotein [Bacteroidales bacterium]|nr:LPP20 family lipoprotein [Bacteroidales bacterium]
MKRFFAMAILLFAGMTTMAQNYPSEWARYTSDGYFHDIESAQYKQDALDLARSNLARQIQVRVKEISKIDKQVINGRSSISYNSSKGFSTDVDMKLAQTLSSYDENLGKYYVIAYINKEEVCNFYENEMKMLISNIGSHIAIADNYISAGFKTKAKEELQTTLALFGQKDEPLFWLNVFGLDENKMQRYLNEVNSNEQAVKSKLADLEHGVNIYLNCKADMFGNSYPTLANTIKGELSKIGCTFVTSAAEADWAVYVTANAREYNAPTIGGHTTYFAYIDATLAIDKVVTNQRIYEDALTEKGGHTHNYTEAARDGYKQISPKIIELINQYIKQ